MLLHHTPPQICETWSGDVSEKLPLRNQDSNFPQTKDTNFLESKFAGDFLDQSHREAKADLRRIMQQWFGV